MAHRNDPYAVPAHRGLLIPSTAQVHMYYISTPPPAIILIIRHEYTNSVYVTYTTQQALYSTVMRELYNFTTRADRLGGWTPLAVNYPIRLLPNEREHQDPSYRGRLIEEDIRATVTPFIREIREEAEAAHRAPHPTTQQLDNLAWSVNRIYGLHPRQE